MEQNERENPVDEGIMMEKMRNRHFIQTDDSGRITGGWSDGLFPDRDFTGAVLLREDGGYQLQLMEDGEENPRLTDDLGAHLWRWEHEAVRASTAEELEAERAEIEANAPVAPTTMQEQMNDQIETDVDLDYRLSMLELGLI